MKMALASEGGSMGTWQSGLGPANGQAQALSTNCTQGFPILRAMLCDGNFYPHLNRGGLGFGKVQELLRSHC